MKGEGMRDEEEMTTFAQRKKQQTTMQQPSIYFVLFHSPGPQWVHSLSFREQPGVMEHVAYMAAFAENGTLLLGGPFLDNSGGMMILKAETMEEAEKIANDDPTVKSGLLNVQVRQWMAAMKGEG